MRGMIVMRWIKVKMTGIRVGTTTIIIIIVIIIIIIIIIILFSVN